ncbi:MAG: protein kinase [Phycisphaerales bacterium]
MNDHDDRTNFDPGDHRPRRPTRREPAPGDRIDRYVIREEVGRGGFGVVYRAEQTTDIQRPVALKLILTGMDTREVHARFEAERQVLAIMRHPGIASVLDAGVTEHGRPYFVMEYISGRPIDAWVARERAPIKVRLDLLEQVARAIQHAHHRGVVHRDIKASNVLVQETEHGPRAVVIDFGVAKALHPGSIAAANLTQRGQPIGTLHAMAPEQLAGDTDAIDTRSDIFAMGVLGYQLLTGHPPHVPSAEDGCPRAAMVRLHAAPPDPPHALIRPDDPESDRFAAELQMDARSLHRWLRGDIRHVLMCCLERQRDDRYESAAMFERDVRRVRTGAPALAGPPSLWRRGRGLLHRHRAGVAVGSIILAAVVVSGAALVLNNQTLRRQRGLGAMLDAGVAASNGDRSGVDAAAEMMPGGREWAFATALARGHLPTRAGHAKLGVSGLLVTDTTPLRGAAGFAIAARGFATSADGTDGADGGQAIVQLIHVTPPVGAAQTAADPVWTVKKTPLPGFSSNVRIAALGNGRVLCVDSRPGRAMVVPGPGGEAAWRAAAVEAGGDAAAGRSGAAGTAGASSDNGSGSGSGETTEAAIAATKPSGSATALPLPALSGTIGRVLAVGDGGVALTSTGAFWLEFTGNKALTESITATPLAIDGPAIRAIIPTGSGTGKDAAPAALVLHADGSVSHVTGRDHVRRFGPDRTWSDRGRMTRVRRRPVDRSVGTDGAGRSLAVGDEHGLIERFDLTDPASDGPTHRWRPHDGAVNALRVLDEGARIVSGGRDGTVVEWRRGSDAARIIGRTPAPVVDVFTAGAPGTIASLDADGIVSVWRSPPAMLATGFARQLVAGDRSLTLVTRSGPDSIPKVFRWPMGSRWTDEPRGSFGEQRSATRPPTAPEMFAPSVPPSAATAAPDAAAVAESESTSALKVPSASSTFSASSRAAPIDLRPLLGNVRPKAIAIHASGDVITVIGQPRQLGDRTELPVRTLDLSTWTTVASGSLPIFGGNLRNLELAVSDDGGTLVIGGKRATLAGPPKAPGTLSETAQPRLPSAPLVSGAWTHLRRTNATWTPATSGWQICEGRIFDVAVTQDGRTRAVSTDSEVLLDHGHERGRDVDDREASPIGGSGEPIAPTRREPGVIRIPTTEVLAIDFSPDGKWLAAAVERHPQRGHEGQALMIDVADAVIAWSADATLNKQPAGILCGPNGRWLLVSGVDGLELRTRSSGRMTLGPGHALQAIAMQPDGKQVFAASGVATSNRGSGTSSRIMGGGGGPATSVPVEIRAFPIDR